MAKILIGVPAFGGQVRIEFAHCLLATVIRLLQDGHYVELRYTTSESLIQRARNSLATTALNGDFTHLLMLDADLVFSASDVVRMLAADLPIVGLNYAVKNLNWDAIAEAAKRDTPAKDLAAAGTTPAGVNDLVPTGVMIIQRRVLEALADQPERWYSLPQLNAKLNGHARECDFFRVGVTDGIFLSEDFHFCRDAKALGFEARILEANTSHIGSMAFEHRAMG